MIPMALTLTQARVSSDSPAEAVAMDEAEFHVFYERTACALRAYLTRACGDPALGDDLLQESYLRFLRAGFVGESHGHRKNYLFRIATNLLRDHFRRRRPEVELLQEREVEAHHEPDPHVRSDVGRALAELSVKDRQMLWLAYAEGASHREIAAVLGLRTASIRSMLFRARRRLVEKLAEGGFGPEGVAP